MNKDLSTKTLGIIGSFFVMIVVIGAFFFVWKSAQPATVTDVAIDQKYKKVEISALKTEAEKMIADRQNAGDLPVKAPTADQVGKDNPFVKP